MAKITLTYGKARGRAEVTHIILKMNDVTFEDRRIADEWKDEKASKKRYLGWRHVRILRSQIVLFFIFCRQCVWNASPVGVGRREVLSEPLHRAILRLEIRSEKPSNFLNTSKVYQGISEVPTLFRTVWRRCEGAVAVRHDCWLLGRCHVSCIMCRSHVHFDARKRRGEGTRASPMKIMKYTCTVTLAKYMKSSHKPL